ncbi:hypothetical protein [Campylobacter troglodytis]|uniref:hypothetical protein n=1 Tax=Campylobacter troglodytis TaxID=654363 RepID=UPI00115A6EC9|nr:hypothetical protein [Campylobacter troglodytis]TQR54341.1 hypothetical protein DMC01_10355 [Campylobacter troglodytis]
MQKLCLVLLLALVFSACANHSSTNAFYEEALKNSYCDDGFFKEERSKVDKNSDAIYVGINAGALARNCKKYEESNYLLDKAEDAYKYDVDLQGLSKKGSKLVASALINEGVLDYEGSLYERIMVNVYKGLNFMSLDDFANARVEFNRALMRQDKAKEYFAKEIEANRQSFEKARQDANYAQNMNQNYQEISQRYEHLLKDFDTTKNFINPYATYMASVFFFLDEDYKKAADLFKEVAVINSKNAEFNKEFAIFNQYANSTNPQNLKKYIFVVLESGFGAGLDEWSMSVPLIFDGNFISASLALPMLKTRQNSYEYILANESKTVDFVNFDNIIATEFKINSSFIIGKALSSMIVKTSLNAAVAKNDPTEGLLSLAISALNNVTTRADLRFWTSLPKYAKIIMIENLGHIHITSDNFDTIYSNDELPKNKNLLIVVKSFTKTSPSIVWLIEKERR